jgi:RimJ/RimL family protein N-acetyltransferase
MRPRISRALRAAVTKRGWATETARAALRRARERAGMTDVVAGVDEANAASLRVLRQLGAETIATHEGAGGPALLLRLPPAAPARRG